MYDTEIAVQSGPMRFSNPPQKSDEWDETIKQRIPAACRQMKAAKTLKYLAAQNLAIAEKNYKEIRAGDDATIDSRWTTNGGVNGFFSVAIRYRVKALGVIPLWGRFQCQMFETERDTEGRTHLVPYTHPT